MRLIDGDALLSGYDVRKVVEFDESGCGVDYKAVPVEVIEAAPTVDAEPVRHGTWDSFGVRRTDAKGRNRIEYMFNACTLCENPVVKRTAYCPNCGAKMDGDVNATD